MFILCEGRKPWTTLENSAAGVHPQRLILGVLQDCTSWYPVISIYIIYIYHIIYPNISPWFRVGFPSRCRGTGRGLAGKHQVRYLGPGQQPAPWTWDGDPSGVHGQFMGIFTESDGEIMGNLVSMIVECSEHPAVRMVLLIVPPSFLLYPQTPWVQCCVLIVYGSKVALTIEIVASLNRTQPICWSLYFFPPKRDQIIFHIDSYQFLHVVIWLVPHHWPISYPVACSPTGFAIPVTSKNIFILIKHGNGKASVVEGKCILSKDTIFEDFPASRLRWNQSWKRSTSGIESHFFPA